MQRNWTDSFSFLEIVAKSNLRDRKVYDSEFNADVRAAEIVSLLIVSLLRLACVFRDRRAGGWSQRWAQSDFGRTINFSDH